VPGNDAPHVVAWVEGYERAWRTAGTAGLAALFTPDATYAMTPFDEPRRGLAAIEVLWDEERTGPDEPFTLRSEVVAVSGDRAVVRLEVRYGRPSDQLFRDLWVLRFAADGRCAEFEEWPFWPERGAVPER
jgi:ketosteroid isomerase-like protein